MRKNRSIFSPETHPPSIWHSWVIIVLFLMVFSLSGCTDDLDQFIQGKWGNGNVHYWSEWNFDRGTYSYYYDFDINRTNTFESGRYGILESTEDYIVLELFNQQGRLSSTEDRVELRIDIDRVEDSISVRRQKFYRVTSSSLEELATAKAP